MAPVREHQERLDCEDSIGQNRTKAFVLPHTATGAFRTRDEMGLVLFIQSGCSSRTGWGEDRDGTIERGTGNIIKEATAMVQARRSQLGAGRGIFRVHVLK